MKFSIDLYARFQASFGFVAPVTEPVLSQVKSKFSSNKYYINGNYNFADLHLKNGNQEFQFGDFNSTIATAGDKIFVAPPMISLSREKVINVSKPDRGEGEVVENFSKRSWEITLKGLIVDMENHLYPSSQVRRLRQFFDIDAVYEVVKCQLFTDLGIHAIYITDFDDLSGVEGFEDTMSYGFKARSFQPVEFLEYGQ